MEDNLQELTARSNLCATKIIEVLGDKKLSKFKTNYLMRYWEYQSKLVEEKIALHYEAIKEISSIE